jgi:hypothetical protein
VKPRKKPVKRIARAFRCEPITKAERNHYCVPHGAAWQLSYERFQGKHGWVLRRRYASDTDAELWCGTVGIAFPGNQGSDGAPISCAHDPDHGAARAGTSTPTNVDVRARAAGEQEG